ncbi:MAG: hypothetical protein KGR26_14490, partial [Cyanobacteria bacterium REEB65]|nr:hypothetical protein [Cyanobacteria bacterium REEB65]
MRFKACALLVGALLAAGIGVQAPVLAAVTTNSSSATIPNNNPNMSVSSSVNEAMGHLREAFSSAAQAQVDVTQGKYADASKEINDARSSIDMAGKVKHLPASLAHTIARLNARIPTVQRSINEQSTRAKQQTASFMAAMSH